VVLEGTFGWGWMADELKAAGLAPRLANSRKVAAWRRSRGLAKSNRLDSDLLSELPSQQPPWWEVWLAPPAVREQRECMRYRMALVGMPTALKNRIHAVLHRHGILHEYSDLFGVQGRRFLSLLVTEKEWDRLQRGEPACALHADRPPLPESARATLKGHLQTLDQVRRQIARVTREVRQQVRRSPVARRLQTIPGIGWILAYVILAEIGRIERFQNARHLASYSLPVCVRRTGRLAPVANDSGEENPDEPPQGRHVGFIGRRTLKWAFIEAAQTAIRCPGRLKDIYDRRTNGGKRDRNRGVIAVAHELARMA
jgi:transposase